MSETFNVIVQYQTAVPLTKDALSNSLWRWLWARTHSRNGSSYSSFSSGKNKRIDKEGVVSSVTDSLETDADIVDGLDAIMGEPLKTLMDPRATVHILANSSVLDEILGQKPRTHPVVLKGHGELIAIFEILSAVVKGHFDSVKAGNIDASARHDGFCSAVAELDHLVSIMAASSA